MPTKAATMLAGDKVEIKPRKDIDIKIETISFE